MKERRILFTGPMVRALRENRKTNTRPLRGLEKLNEEPDAWEVYDWEGVPGPYYFRRGDTGFMRRVRCPFGVVGDRLWTRELTERYLIPHFLTGEPTEGWGGRYVEDLPSVLTDDGFDLCWWYGKPSCPPIHMPRWASRDTLEIVDVRPERLQDINEVSAIAPEQTKKGFAAESSEMPGLQPSQFAGQPWSRRMRFWSSTFSSRQRPFMSRIISRPRH